MRQSGRDGCSLLRHILDESNSVSHPAVCHRRSDFVSILTKQVWAVETIKATTSVKTACIRMCFGSDYVGGIHQHAAFECRPVVAAASCESPLGNRIFPIIQTDFLVRRQGEQWTCEQRGTNWAFENDGLRGHRLAQSTVLYLISSHREKRITNIASEQWMFQRA